MGVFAVREHFSRRVLAFVATSTYRSEDRCAEVTMRLRGLYCLFGSLILVAGTAGAVDRGQFENVPEHIHSWFKAVRSPADVPCCDIADGHRTICDVRAGGYARIPICDLSGSVKVRGGLQWGPPTSTFKMNSGGSSYVWQLSAVTEIAVDRGYGTAATIGRKVSVITSPTGIVTHLDTEDHNPGGSGSIGLASVMGAYGSMCGQRLGMMPQG
jgi:hypothetical protein